ncbi:MAG: Acg family FMN-binding oxidoreductase [Hyphomicrobiaceae bacterium]
MAGGGLALAGAGASYAGLSGMGSIESYSAAVGATRAPLAAMPNTHELIRYATLAASGHNAQPWRFRVGDGQIAVLPDLARRTPIVDPDDHHLFVSLGCASENLSLASGAQGRPGTIAFDPAAGGAVVVTFGPGPAENPALVAAIPKRQSTRADYDGRPVSAADLRTLAASAALPGVDLVLMTDRQQMDRVRDLVVAGNTAQMADPAFLRELKSWLRFSPREAALSGDGLFGAASGSPILPSWLGPSLFDWVFRAESENAKYASQLRSSSGIAVFVSEKDDREHWALAGRACQRFALQATALGIKQAYINQPVEVPSLRPALASLAGLPGRRPDIVMRFGFGPTLPFSARRPVQGTLMS